MNWIVFALLTAFFYGLYNFFIKVSSGSINQIVGAVILQLEITPKGVYFAILAGIFVGLAEITSFYVFSKGTAASLGIPVIIGISIVVGAVLGLAFLKESLNLVQWLAMAMIVAGVILLVKH